MSVFCRSWFSIQGPQITFNCSTPNTETTVIQPHPTSQSHMALVMMMLNHQGQKARNVIFQRSLIWPFSLIPVNAVFSNLKKCTWDNWQNTTDYVKWENKSFELEYQPDFTLQYYFNYYHTYTHKILTGNLVHFFHTCSYDWSVVFTHSNQSTKNGMTYKMRLEHLVVVENKFSKIDRTLWKNRSQPEAVSNGQSLTTWATK